MEKEIKMESSSGESDQEVGVAILRQEENDITFTSQAVQDERLRREPPLISSARSGPQQQQASDSGSPTTTTAMLTITSVEDLTANVVATPNHQSQIEEQRPDKRHDAGQTDDANGVENPNQVDY